MSTISKTRHKEKEIETATKNRRELIDAKLGRRELWKLGLLTGAGYLVAKRGLSARAVRADGTPTGQPTSQPTTPFVEPLPIPPVKQPVPFLNPAPTVAPNAAAGEGRTRPHQALTRFPPKKFYEVHVREASHSFHPQLPVQKIWGHDGIFPGPTFVARYGEPILVRRFNDLPANHVGYGIPQIITHLHNAHTPSESDGFPDDFYNSGQWYDHHYPLVFAGVDQFPSTLGDPDEALTTLWYHDHRVDFTAQNTYRGLEGFFIQYDPTDTGDETDPNPKAYRLPSGQFDVPLLFADKLFDSNGQVYYDSFNFDGILGDKFTVNGKIQPFFQVHPRKYRFRCLNGGPSRFYEFFLTDLNNPGQAIPFTLVANENMLTAPLQVTSFRLGVAERMDAVIDFSQFKPGSSICLENRLEQVDGRGPTGKILPAGQGNLVMRFDVVLPAVPDSSRVPAVLTEIPDVNMNEVVATRNWVFHRSQGAWQVNGRFFDPNTVQAAVKKNTAEIWVLKNGGGGWSHPVHIHFEESRILSRNGSPPAPHEATMKDVFTLGPGDEVVVFRRMRDFTGKFPVHCHNTVHEDHAMMARWDIVE